MRAPAETLDDLRDAYAAADVLVSAKFRPYLHTSGRLLPVLVGRFRDDVALALPAHPHDEQPARSASTRLSSCLAP